MALILLHDSDKTSFPNLPLMKLSAWHKSRGDRVEWYAPELEFEADKIYASKVFTFTPEPDLPSWAERGGTGWISPTVVELPTEIEHIAPDYELYTLPYSVGFATRGCPRKCEWCFVPEKEGDIREHSHINEWVRHRDVVFLDNNILAHKHGVHTLELCAERGLRIDINQGIDARLIDDSIARLFKKIKWMHPLRLACDTAAAIRDIDRAVDLLRWHNVTPSRYFCYVLVTEDVDDAVERVRFLKKVYVDPFCQPFMDREGTLPTKRQRAFCRWANMKAEFKSRPWEDYEASKKGEKP